MKTLLSKLLILAILAAGCRNNFYSQEDFAAVEKIDSHIHIGSDDGVFEKQAEADNFRLITLNVDHGDSSNLARQLDYAMLSAREYPGRVFYRRR